MSHNFNNLNPMDFEHLCKDLLEAERAISLEIFSKGRDGGIDLRHSYKNGDLIIQCKHYPNSTFSDLKTSMAKEKLKMDKLKCKKYILITSLKLTPDRKKKIKEICEPYIKSTGDIYGLEEIEAMIRKNPEIEKSHIKLWLSSAAVLEKLLRKASDKVIEAQSKYEIKESLKQSKIYVQTKSFKDSLDKLEEDNFVIISGEPGVGKTLLARMLYLHFIEQEYQFINITSNINDAIQMISNNENVRQIFYFDDFLGQTSLIEKGKVEDCSKIMMVINTIRDSGHKFIFTTREYILQDALSVEEKLYNMEDQIKLLKYTLKLSDYEERERTLILYNHLLYYKVDKIYIKDIVKDKRYKDIINHKNYNPRLIEAFTKNIDNDTSDFSYYNYVIDILNNPSKLWEKPFQKLSEESKSLVLSLWSFSTGFSTSMKEVRDYFNELHRLRSKKYNFKTHIGSFNTGLKGTEGSFSITDEKKYIKFCNPSIIDFLNEYVKKNPEILESLLGVTLSVGQLYKLHSYITSEYCSKKIELIATNHLDLYQKDRWGFSYQKYAKIFLHIFPYIESEEVKNRLLKFYLSYGDKDDSPSSYYIMGIYNEAIKNNIFPLSFLNQWLKLIFDNIESQPKTGSNINRYDDLYEIGQVLNYNTEDVVNIINDGIEESVYEVMNYDSGNIIDDVNYAKEALDNIDCLSTDIYQKLDLNDKKTDLEAFIQDNEPIYNDEYDREDVFKDKRSIVSYNDGIIESLLSDEDAMLMKE
ncbi:MAG: restriction endonuclease [Alphaproteobacteria bacterium]|jgi:hypothetical protein|nr:restriction endonuclease [Alphaproteobacteria bacterium]